MITHLKNRLATFRKDETGSYTVEFAIIMPVVCFAFFFGVELTTHSNRQFQLDRAVEVTARAIRLNTGNAITHDDIKTAICDNSGGLADCQEKLRLELLPMNPREFTGLPVQADCIDTNATPVNPVRGWSLGQQHDLMIIRACYNFDPVMPFIGLGQKFASEDGNRTMVAMSAFVQEPQ